MSTLYYPDVSGYQRGISFSGAPACCVEATESTNYTSPDYGPAKGRAASAGAWFFAYHFLHAGNAAGQAAYCQGVVGGTPLMLDVEVTGSSQPGMADTTGFIDRYRQLGGICNLCYLPRWYWQQIGSPSLGGLISRKVAVVSSAYTGYTDASNGTGWQPYGGITPSIWQYTDAHAFNGQKVDFNAYRGSLDQLEALAVRAELVSCRPSCVPLHSLPGAPWVCALPRRAATDRRPR